VVEAELENGEEGEKSLRTYWIDKERFLVLKAIQSVQVEASAESGPMETRITTTLSWARIHEDFPDSWFVFQPPQDAKQVAEFRSLRAGGADSIGQPAADFTLRDLAGTEIQLKSLRGQVVLLNFWASWCGPCRLEMPVIEKLHHEFKDKGLQVFGINDEDVETIREYLSEFEYTFPTLVDEGQQVARLYRVRGIPTMVVIDRAGTVSHYRVGLSRERDLRGWLKTAGIE
jgi:peroxiredoxin